MRWKVAEAKQRFSEVLRAAGQEPQLVFNRDRLVAAVLDPVSFQAFQAWKEQEQASLADIFAEVRAICAEDGYVLEVPPRRDRANPFTEALENATL